MQDTPAIQRLRDIRRRRHLVVHLTRKDGNEGIRIIRLIQNNRVGIGPPVWKRPLPAKPQGRGRPRYSGPQFPPSAPHLSAALLELRNEHGTPIESLPISPTFWAWLVEFDHDCLVDFLFQGSIEEVLADREKKTWVNI